MPRRSAEAKVTLKCIHKANFDITNVLYWLISPCVFLYNWFSLIGQALMMLFAILLLLFTTNNFWSLIDAVVNTIINSSYTFYDAITKSIFPVIAIVNNISLVIRNKFEFHLLLTRSFARRVAYLFRTIWIIAIVNEILLRRD